MTSRRDGFSLLELLLALALGLTLVAVIGEALLGKLGQSGRLARLLRERSVSQRALELMRIELQEAPAVQVTPSPVESELLGRKGCGLAGRKVLLHLDFIPQAGGPEPQPGHEDVTYSLERNPDPIWRGRALMRCGPAYDLDGQIEKSEAVSRVWLDGLAADGLVISPHTSKALTLKLIRSFQQTAQGHGLHQMATTITVPVPGLP